MKNYLSGLLVTISLVSACFCQPTPLTVSELRINTDNNGTKATINETQLDNVNNTIVTGGRVATASGSVSTLPWYFVSDANTGIANTASDTLDIVTNGVSRLSIDTSDAIFTVDITAPNFSGSNTGDVTVSGENYLSITGQAITANEIDISTNTNLSGNSENVLTGDTLSIGSAITRDSEVESLARASFSAGTGIGISSGAISFTGVLPTGDPVSDHQISSNSNKVKYFSPGIGVVTLLDSNESLVDNLTVNSNLYIGTSSNITFTDEVGLDAFTTVITSSSTANRTINLPDASGTLALTSNIPTVGTIASQDADDVAITGGSISGVPFIPMIKEYGGDDIANGEIYIETTTGELMWMDTSSNPHVIVPMIP